MDMVFVLVALGYYNLNKNTDLVYYDYFLIVIIFCFQHMVYVRFY